MGKKLAMIAAAGAGYYLYKREMKNNPDGQFAQMVRKVTENPQVAKATDKTKEKVGETVRKQGEAVTDKVADAVKQKLFSQEPKSTKPEYVDVEVEEVVVEPPRNR